MIPWRILARAAVVVAACIGQAVADELSQNRPAPALFVSVPASLDGLKRAPVLFPHDAHTAALKQEGCVACHPKQGNVRFFTFPKERSERSRNAFMDSVHDACIGCHTERADKKLKSGPVTCGECHAEAKQGVATFKTAPAAEYDAGEDPYHRQCLACHKDGQVHGKHAGALDWKRFYTREQARVEAAMPAMVFDYVVHDKHQKTLEKRCELCHFIAPELKQRLAAKGNEPTGQDWLREEEPGKSLKKRAEAHARCINCHLQRRDAKESSGPVICGECHGRRSRPLGELAGILPPDYGSKERLLIHSEQARMPAVAFDHKAHITASASCGECHHATLDPCAKCHTANGSKDGGFVTLAESYHSMQSRWSCAGCHAERQRTPDCAGCHHLRHGDLPGSSCAKCHTGRIESLDSAVKLTDPVTLFPTNLHDELVVSVLTKEFEPAKVQHKKIAQKLTEISNASRLATYFHRDEMTLCAGCHHNAPVEKGKPVPPCATCHSARPEPVCGTSTLLGAYHQACLGCHQEMGYPEKVMPQKCEGCHAEKKAAS